MSKPLAYAIDERSDAGDGDLDFIAARQAERIGWNDAGAGQQETAGRESVVPIEVANQVRGIALQRFKRGRTRKGALAVALYLQPDLGGCGQRRISHQNARPERAASVVNLGLRQIERILAFDIP